MSVKSMAYLADYEHRDLRKNIGCINGILQVFNRYRFAGRQTSNNHGFQGEQHQLEPHSAERTDTEKDEQTLNKKARIYTDSCCTSPFSSPLSSFESETQQFRRAGLSKSPFPSTPQSGIKSNDGEEIKCFVMKTKASCLDSKATSNNKTSSIVVRLMGLEDFSGNENTSPKTKAGRTEASISQNCIKKSGDCTKFLVEPVPWSSVYGEIEKRISELEFNKSGKDLRALKQVLEGMQKTTDKCEMTSYRGTSISKTTPKEMMQSTSIMIMKPTKLKDQVPVVERQQQIRSPRHHLHPAQTKMDLDRQSSPTHVKAEPCATCGRSFPTENLSSPLNLQKKSKKDNEISVKKLTGKGSPDRNSRLNEVHQQYNSQGGKVCANSTIHNALVSRPTEIMQTAGSINMVTRKKQFNSRIISSESRQRFPAIKIALDDAFYREYWSSPVKKLHTFSQDERPRSKGAKGYLENLKQMPQGKSSDQVNPRCRKKKHSFKEPRSRNIDLDEIASTHNESSNGYLKPDYRYINKILLTSGILENLQSIPVSNRILPSGHLFDPEMFNFLEKTEEYQKSNTFNRRITFDLVDEILVRKMTSGRSDTIGKKVIPLDSLLKEINRKVETLCRVHNSSMEQKVDGMIIKGDTLQQLEEWGETVDEIPVLVLEVERLLIKDLINELVVIY